MRISIDATGLGAPKTGTVVYVTEILREWNADQSIDHEFIVFGNDHTFHHCAPLKLDKRFRLVRSPRSRHLRTLWQQVMLPWHIRRIRAHVHWGTGFVLPLVARLPQVVTIHDLTHQIFPEVHERIKRYYFPVIIGASVKVARMVIAVSDTTKSDLHRLLPDSRTKTITTMLAARSISNEPSNSADAPRTPGDYILFVGTVEPRKNLARLIAAWRRLDRDIRRDTRLVIVGAKGWMVDKLMAPGDRAQGIEYQGHIGDAELSQLMRNAKAFAYPSLYEGFGLPVLEAMMVGTPVLTSDAGAVREIAAGASLLVDPVSEDSIREGLVQLLTDDDFLSRLSVLGKARAQQFSWTRTARETIDVIERSVLHG